MYSIRCNKQDTKGFKRDGKMTPIAAKLSHQERIQKSHKRKGRTEKAPLMAPTKNPIFEEP